MKTLYELLFCDSDVDAKEEATEDFLQLLVVAVAAAEDKRVTYHVCD
jgi:hypothetical protein